MNSKSNAQAMETEKIPRLLAQLAIPAVVAQIINLLYNIVDRIYIGHIPGVGAAALTGVGLFTPILMLINAFAMLAGSGGAPRAAISMLTKYCPDPALFETRAAWEAASANAHYIWYYFAAIGLIAAIALLLFAKITESIDKKKKSSR